MHSDFPELLYTYQPGKLCSHLYTCPFLDVCGRTKVSRRALNFGCRFHFYFLLGLWQSEPRFTLLALLYVRFVMPRYLHYNLRILCRRHLPKRLDLLGIPYCNARLIVFPGENLSLVEKVFEYELHRTHTGRLPETFAVVSVPVPAQFWYAVSFLVRTGIRCSGFVHPNSFRAILAPSFFLVILIAAGLILIFSLLAFFARAAAIYVMELSSRAFDAEGCTTSICVIVVVVRITR